MPFAAELGVQPGGFPAEATPAECPGVFMEQPLERWSPRDLVVCLRRLVRRTGLATS